MKELGDASVPFPFDVHMMISCDDAPALERALHRGLHKMRLNKVNFRREFFRVDFEDIRKIVHENHGVVEYVIDPAVIEYHESLNIKDEDAQYVEQTFGSLLDAEAAPFAD